ncbi:MAG TPA: DUF2935 domain-containing protein [Thermoclostridium caenicola]|uniref:DUF2935 domain-containing protein n=1 Tax=Thermoclostridium caenicola TaxID=659425 RepID=UPI002C5034C5|nr:DUF2935 domain-containing protein [Thermoclostridium caenicola]HOK43713.1 DUF2935 domain-containing protein [Thermoclostridium caenicola]HOL85300.1 DUF2935 domain-containing protein [Thermoclostridium caenicola]HPO77412.1 DUF2935 domain-containing protein [Thermoclostridium caenicola]HPU21975.1 DUF2935 domain-containing protein [Thermoclostridium caenicola]
MLSGQEFVRVSLETNLFFQRIMKEHLFFFEISLPPVESLLIQEANALKRGFEQLLGHSVYYATGIVSEQAVKSNILVTPYTLRAEEMSVMLTGASLSTEITKAEYSLGNTARSYQPEWPENIMDEINRRSYNLLKEVIAFQKKLFELRLECRIFMFVYSALLHHVDHEAEYYMKILESLMQRKLPGKNLCDELNLWNHIMEEHAQFIDGMLDPTEEKLKETARATANTFDRLSKGCTAATARQILQNSITATEGISAFKKAATEGLLQCRIRSVIPPLLADHVWRESNYYLQLLDSLKQS